MSLDPKKISSAFIHIEMKQRGSRNKVGLGGIRKRQKRNEGDGRGGVEK